MSLVNFIIQGTLLGSGILILVLILLYWLRWIKERCRNWRHREEISREFSDDGSDEREEVEVKHIDAEVGNTDTDSVNDSNSLLCRKAIYKHIHPECTTEEEAIQISEERNDYFKTHVNHVFQLHETEFEFANHDGAEVIKSKRPGAYWECRRGRNNSEYMVFDTGIMYAIFNPRPECHLLIRESKNTRIG